MRPDRSTTLVSVDEGARMMGISKFTVRSWLRQARLSYIRLGRRVMLDPRDIERFIESNRVEERKPSR